MGPRVRRVALVSATALLLGGCGGDDKEVKDAVAQFAAATETEDARAACRAISPESREVLTRLAKARYGRGGCETLFAARFKEAGRGAFAIDPARIAGLEEADVEIDGDRAEIDTFGDDEDLPLVRRGDEWRLDLVEIPAQRYAVLASTVCSSFNAGQIEEPLPAPTRAGYARATLRAADTTDALAAKIGRVDPPPAGREADAELRAALRGQARELRAIARSVRGGGPVLESVSRRGERLADLQRRALTAQRRLDVACDVVGFRPGGATYRRRAERICRAVSVRIDRLGQPQSPAELGPYMRRVRAAGAAASRGLRALRAPSGLGSLHRRTVEAYDDALAAIPPIARAGDPAAAYDRYGLRSLRASTGFTRLGLPVCASL